MKHVKILMSGLFFFSFSILSINTLAVETISPIDFLNKALLRNISTIESGKLALRSSSLPEVKEYAQIMINEHTLTNKAVTILARQKNIDIVDEAVITKKMSAFVNKQIDETAFDLSYIRLQVSAHQRTVRLLRVATKSDDADISSYAKNVLPEVMHDLYRAQHLLEKINTPSVAAL